ncbi:MAG TPA: HEPN domain-containing protein [Chthoniobacterales bacterium]|jgi:HEPN domain-containing protein
MADAGVALVASWLEKASNDLKTARIIGAAADGPLDTAIYHCQQAAEKSIKGYLVFRETAFEKSHDVVRLVRQAEAVDDRFAQFLGAAELLTPLAWQFRYPTDLVGEEPTRAQFDEALEHAQTVYDFVLNTLPAETHPA